MNTLRKDAAAMSLGSRGLIDRMLGSSDLAIVVPRLSPELLHRVVQRCGLEECGELLALATAEQLAGVLDLDVWHADQPGLDEEFDAERFGVWIETLVEGGARSAAEIVSRLDVDLVAAALAHHARVFDPAAVSASMDSDGLTCEVGGYLIAATRSDSWDAIVAMLTSLDADQHECFDRVMRRCRRLSNSRPEIDGLDNLLTDQEQASFDLAFHRENRREHLGYVTPAQARAFLRMSRELQLADDTPPAGSPSARAYFRAMEPTEAADTSSAPGARGRRASFSRPCWTPASYSSRPAGCSRAREENNRGTLSSSGTCASCAMRTPSPARRGRRNLPTWQTRLSLVALSRDDRSRRRKRPMRPSRPATLASRTGRSTGFRRRHALRSPRTSSPATISSPSSR